LKRLNAYTKFTITSIDYYFHFFVFSV